MPQIAASTLRSAVTGIIFRSPFEFTGAAFTRQAYIAADAITRLHRNVRSFREPLEEVHKIVIPLSIGANFRASGRPPWPALSDATLKRRGWKPSEKVTIGGRTFRGTRPKPTHQMKFQSPFGMLYVTGHLFKMAMRRNMWSISNNQLSFRPIFFSGKVSYGPFQQLGTRNMPARPFIRLTEGEKDLILDIFEDWLRLKIGKYWTIVENQGKTGTTIIGDY